MFNQFKNLSMIDVFDYIKGLFYALFVFLGIKVGIVEVLFYLMVLDSVLGIVKALRLNHKFSFKVLAWGIVSKLTLLIIPFIVALMAKGLDFDFNYFVIAIMNILIVNEGISCITNILSIKTKKQIENTDYISKMLEAIRRAFMVVVDRLIYSVEIKKDNNTKK